MCCVLQVYGETSFELVDQMIKSINFNEETTFIDLGSGEKLQQVGQNATDESQPH